MDRWNNFPCLSLGLWKCCIHGGGCASDLVRAALKEHKKDTVQKQGCRNPLPTLSLIYSYSGWMQMRRIWIFFFWVGCMLERFFCCCCCCFLILKAREFYLTVRRLPWGCLLRRVELFNSFTTAGGLSYFTLQAKGGGVGQMCFYWHGFSAIKMENKKIALQCAY